MTSSHHLWFTANYIQSSYRLSQQAAKRSAVEQAIKQRDPTRAHARHTTTTADEVRP